MNVDVDVAGIVKDDTTEDDKIAADEATRVAHEEATKKTAEEPDSESTGDTDNIPAAGALGANPTMIASIPRQSCCRGSTFNI